MSPTEHTACRSSSATGFSATLCALLHIKGTGARSPRYALATLVTLLTLCASGGGLLFASTPAFAAGDANEASCPNEATAGFTVALPDCRAYEQVTPAFKDGSELVPEYISDDGATVLAQSLGAFAGLESDTAFGGTYQLSRSASGWSVSAVSPPAAQFPAQTLVGANAALTGTLWLARGPSESIGAENLYRREAGGEMVKIGPLYPPSAVTGPPAGEYEQFYYSINGLYRDASSDLSHVLFSILEGGANGLSWPGDSPKSNKSLYEYVGVGQTHPELVGVNTEGHLISPCSTFLGSSGSNDVYNAVSGDGETVFFTAQEAGECGAPEGPVVDELFARVDQLETVSVSEPSATQCAACNTGVREAAQFAGASEDGSKVFFLTSQELLPGTTGSSMGLYEYDFDNKPGGKVLRVSTGSEEPDVQGVARVSEDGSHVYFVAQGRLSKGARGGGDVGGAEGPCLAELSPAERAQELLAQEQEAAEEAVTTGARCRPRLGGDNLYVFERDSAYPGGRVSFIATLCSGDEESGSLTGVAQCPAAEGDKEDDWRRNDDRRVQATPDGQFLVFSSVGHLTEGATDTSRVAQIFEYDAASGELVRVSRGANDDQPQGTQSADGDASEIHVQQYFAKTSPAVPSSGLAISGDGGTVVFSSAGALSGEAQATSEPEKYNAYVYRSQVGSGGALDEGNVFLVSGSNAGLTEGETGQLDASGQDVFFLSAQGLVPGHVGSAFDTYDARINGGFPAADPPAGCVAEACQSLLYAPPAAQSPASTSVSGPGDLQAPPSAPPPPPALPKPKPKPKPLTRAQKLAKALKACRRDKSKSKRSTCEKQARQRYGAKPKAKAKSTKGGE